MPGMNGIEFLKKLIAQYPIPVIVVSAHTVEGSKRAFEALESGAIDVVAKPDAKDSQGLKNMLDDLVEKVKEASSADMRKIRRAVRTTMPGKKAPSRQRAETFLVAIGASTGGTNALERIVEQFPPDMPGVVIVQHMPPVFTRLFAESLNRSSRVEVKEAETGDIVKQGHVYVAPGDFQCTVRRSGNDYRINCEEGEKISGHRPSVDVLFDSVAKAAGKNAIGVLLTGMGRDGADGLLRMKEAGARCFAQDEETSVVFGMPKEAWENGAAEKLVPVEKVTGTILSCLGSTQ
jgi:two-component system chemotaxis response regulator CheB